MSIPKGARVLLDFIGDIEAPRGYNTIYGNNQGKLKKPVTEMTVDEILAEQRSWTRKYGSSATGRYQFMRATLTGLKEEGVVRGDEKLDGPVQDRLGYHLLKRRGYAKYVAGSMSTDDFGKRLAQEWASLPVLKDTKGQKRPVTRGQSYYAGDGLNKSLVDPERVETTLKEVLAGRRRMPEKLQPKPQKGPTERAHLLDGIWWRKLFRLERD